METGRLLAKLLHHLTYWWIGRPRRITPENVAERSSLLIDQYRKKAALYWSNVVIAPLGDDFRYMTSDEAEAQYKNYQFIKDYVNDHVPGVTMQFGMLSDYFQKLQGSFDVPCSREVSLPTRIGNGITGVASLRCKSLIKY